MITNHGQIMVNPRWYEIGAIPASNLGCLCKSHTYVRNLYKYYACTQYNYLVCQG